MDLPPKIQELVNSPRELLTAAQISPLVGQDPNTLRYLARFDPEKLPFTCFAEKNERKVRFSKASVLASLGYQFDREGGDSQCHNTPPNT